MNIYYNYYHNLFESTKDTESLDELKRLYEYDPNFDFDKFRTGIFSLANISKYGYDFLIANIKLLFPEILELGQEKVFFLVNNPESIRLNSNLLEILTLDEIKQLSILMKNQDYTETLNSISSYNNSAKIIRDLLENKKILNRLNYIVTSFEYIPNYPINLKILECIYDDDFDKFIHNVDNNYLKSDTSIIYILERFQDTKKEYNGNNEVFNSYFFNFHLKMNDLENYYEKRLIDVIEYIKNHSITESKEYISETFFNMSYSELNPILCNIINIKNQGTYLPYFRTSNLLKCNTKEELILFVNEIKTYNNIGYSLIKNSKPICLKDLVKTINSKLIKTDSRIKLLEGEDFIFLLHKVKGYSRHDMATKLREDPSYWDKQKEMDSYISTSLVWEDYFSLVEGSGYILGFYPTVEEIIAMGSKDIFITTKQVRNNLNSSKAEFLLTDELKNRSVTVCNEVALKRYQSDQARKPDFVFAFDEIRNSDKEAADYFNVPIYVLNSEIYASKMYEKIHISLSNGDISDYSNRLIKMYLSFSSNPAIIDKYFNETEIYNQLEIIKNMYNEDIYLKVAKEFERIVTLRNYFEENSINFSLKHK